MNRISTAAATALAVLALSTAAPAQALVNHDVHHAHTVFYWDTTECVIIQSPYVGRPYGVHQDRICSPTKGWMWDETVSSGQIYGGKVILDGQSQARCETYLDGTLVLADDAANGDANCLRKVK